MFGLDGVCFDWMVCVWIGWSVFGLDGVCFYWMECVFSASTLLAL